MNVPAGTILGDPRGDAHGITVGYRARFDECGADGLVRSSALLRYAQDLAWIHSERMGFTRAWYAERDMAWVVRAAELVILAPLPLGEVLSLSTAVTGFRRVWSRRRTEGRLADGSLALWAHTDWVMTDSVKGTPGRVPPEFPDAFAVPPGGFEPGRVALPPAPASGPLVHRMRVRPSDIDPMGHVNNAAYLDILEAALLAEGGDAAALAAALPRRFRIEYVQPAAPWAELASTTWALTGDAVAGRAWRLDDADGRELARAIATAEAG